ncbi:unnamed protein product [Phytomonas sp. Hart1]|nr:unnamed protein product [Phytomonas sp. Hart1]|eukprot:CCW70630.1 unnamed protein product [Phytomonas sp. isolate Hart1]
MGVRHCREESKESQPTVQAGRGKENGEPQDGKVKPQGQTRMPPIPREISASVGQNPPREPINRPGRI